MKYDDKLNPNYISDVDESISITFFEPPNGEINKITKKTEISIVIGILHTMVWAILFGAMVMFTLFGIAYYDHLVNYKVFITIGLTVMSLVFFLFNLFETIHKVRRLSK